ncbi:MAG: TetR/AcrR family transcriptional regulator [Cyclobacteriaceae bacterium]
MSPRTKQQFEEIREASAKKIMDAALELFGTVGYQKTSMSQIASTADVSKGLIYNYFSSKEDLLRALMDDLTSLGAEMMSQLLTDNPKETLENILRMTFKWFREHDRMNRLIFGLTLQVDQFDFVNQLADSKIKGYVALLEGLLQQIGFKDFNAEARILATIFDGVCIQYLVLKDDYPLDEIEAMLIRKYCY